MSDEELRFEWKEYGDGWVGRAYRPNGDCVFVELSICPTGGMHGGWAWAVPGANRWGTGAHTLSRPMADELLAEAPELWPGAKAWVEP